MPVMRRKLVWVERRNVHAWACSECKWVFNPADQPIGETLDEMKSHYEQKRDKEFGSHICAEHPKAEHPRATNPEA